MVYDSNIIKAIHTIVKKVKCPVVVDPIIKSTTGKILLKKAAMNDFKKMIIPLATIITPNKKEAKILSGQNSNMNAAKKIQEMGAKNVIITGSYETKNGLHFGIQYHPESCATDQGCVVNPAAAAADTRCKHCLA